MPNWCSNELTVKGPQTEVARFVEENRGVEESAEGRPAEVLSFERVLPRPKDHADLVAWSNENWGTKWDADSVSLREHEEEAAYTFETAWSPPVRWLTEASFHYPELTFELWYAEGGCDFGGLQTMKAGNLLDGVEYSYREALISRRGEIYDLCQYCDREYASNELRPVNSDECPACLATRCLNCNKPPDEHAEGRCLFQPTTYKNREQACQTTEDGPGSKKTRNKTKKPSKSSSPAGTRSTTQSKRGSTPGKTKKTRTSATKKTPRRRASSKTK